MARILSQKRYIQEYTYEKTMINVRGNHGIIFMFFKTMQPTLINLPLTIHHMMLKSAQYRIVTIPSSSQVIYKIKHRSHAFVVYDCY